MNTPKDYEYGLEERNLIILRAAWNSFSDIYKKKILSDYLAWKEKNSLSQSDNT